MTDTVDHDVVPERETNDPVADQATTSATDSVREVSCAEDEDDKNELYAG